MNVLDWILVAIRWSHALAAVAWVGGGAFYILVLRPSLRQEPVSSQTQHLVASGFGGLVKTAVAVLLLTGTILSLSRLTSDAATVSYIAVLAVKVALSLYMFYIVQFLPARRKRPYTENPGTQGQPWLSRLQTRATGATAVLITGIIVFGLADVLDLLFEKALAK